IGAHPADIHFAKCRIDQRVIDLPRRELELALVLVDDSAAFLGLEEPGDEGRVADEVRSQVKEIHGVPCRFDDTGASTRTGGSSPAHLPRKAVAQEKARTRRAFRAARAAS